MFGVVKERYWRMGGRAWSLASNLYQPMSQLNIEILLCASIRDMVVNRTYGSAA